MSQHYQQMQLDYDVDYSYNSIASSITTAANIYPYVTNGTGGYTLSTSGTGGYNLGTTISPSLSDAKLKVVGDAEFDGDIKVKGKSITETLDKIEERLGILSPNEKLEGRWEELKKLGDAYRTLEKEILEKEKIWDTLKK